MKNKLFLFGALILVLSMNGCDQAEIPTVSPLDVKNKIEQGSGFTLLDVRKQDEVDKGVINEGIVNFDFHGDDFKDNISKLDKNDTYYVYCHSGNRSSKAVKMMQEMGFSNVFNVDGGITKWQSSGYKLVQMATP